MKTTVILKTLVVGFLLIGITETTIAQQRGNPDMRKERMERIYDRWQNIDRMAKLMDLSDQQKEEIKEIMLATRQQMLPLRNQMGEQMARLRTLRTSDEVDFEAINAVTEDLGDTRVEMMKKRLASEQEVRALLTEEQRIIFDSRKLAKTHRAHRFHRGG